MSLLQGLKHGGCRAASPLTRTSNKDLRSRPTIERPDGWDLQVCRLQCGDAKARNTSL